MEQKEWNLVQVCKENGFYNFKYDWWNEKVIPTKET